MSTVGPIVATSSTVQGRLTFSYQFPEPLGLGQPYNHPMQPIVVGRSNTALKTRSSILAICLFIGIFALSLGANAAQSTPQECRPPQTASLTAPPGLKINNEPLISSLTSLLDTDSKPLEIDLGTATEDKPLRITLANPKDSGYLIQSSTTGWSYWPGFRSARSKTSLDDRISLIDVCHGDLHTRVQILPTQFVANISDRYPPSYRSPLPHRYETPNDFIQVNSSAEAQRQISPHFKLQQFLPKQPNNKAANTWPQWALIRMPLLEKLERVLAVLAENDKPATTLSILSGYRLPNHNGRVGGATYSRHMYGDAADFIVDRNNDGKMDDLNGDNKVNRADLRWLLRRLSDGSTPITAGGTGAYESHGQAEAFLHLDARGRAFYWQ